LLFALLPAPLPPPTATDDSPLAVVSLPRAAAPLAPAAAFVPSARADAATALAPLPSARVFECVARALMPMAALLAPEAVVALLPTWKWLARTLVVELTKPASPRVMFAAETSTLPTK
jgi:hypothetical protein